MAKKSILSKLKFRKAQELLDQNKLEEAREAFSQLYATDRSNLDALLTLATINRRLNRLDDAQANCQQALIQAPGNARAYQILGTTQHLKHLQEDAIHSYQKSITLDPSLAESHYFLGNAFREMGQFDLAKVSLYKATQLKPDFLEALSNLGAVLIELHQSEEAKQVLDRANRIRPNCEQVICNYSELALLENNLDMALTLAQRAASINPGFIDAQLMLAKIYEQNGEYDKAIESYDRCLDIRADDENTLSAKAALLEKRKQFDESLALVKPILEKSPPLATALLTYSALSRHYGNQLEAIDILLQAISHHTYASGALISLHSELGKQYDQLERYPEAFQHYEQANLIERELNDKFLVDSKWKYSQPAAVDKLTSQFGRDFWHSIPHSSSDSSKPVFIVGMPRSGTSLMEQILASHPDVYGAGELTDISQLARSLGSDSDNLIEYLVKVDEAQLNTAAQKYLDTLDRLSAESTRVINKMPTDFWQIGLISKLLPQAQIIHMRRNPLDVCLSMYFQRFGASMTFTTDLAELGNYYQAYTRMMDYWNETLDIDILHVDYENLVAEQEAVTRRVLEFCSLDWNDQCLEFYNTRRDVNTPSYDQVRKPMYKRSIARWENYRENLAPLIEILGTPA